MPLCFQRFAPPLGVALACIILALEALVPTLAYSQDNPAEEAPPAVSTPPPDAVLESSGSLIEADEGAKPAAAEPATPTESTLVWWNRPITVFRSQTTKQAPDARSEEAVGRIESVADLLLEQEVVTEPAKLEDDRGYRFLAGETYLFTILESDLDELAGETLEAARDQALANLGEIRAARIEQGSAKALVTGLTTALVATAILVATLIVLRLLAKFLAHFVENRIGRWKRLRLARADLRPYFATFAEQLVKVAALVLGLYLVCVWVAFVFNQFPLTEPLGAAFTARLRDLAEGLLRSAAAAVPGLITAGIILLIARWLARIVDRVIGGIARSGDTAILSADTAKATKRIAIAVVWIFGIVLAYPYLPGSGSAAFKGISVLLGLMVSLGSTGMINQVMSGFVLLYSGSIRTGEYVRIGEIEGTVTEMGMLGVKLITAQKEFYSIPNAVMLANPTTNYSRLAKETGVPIKVEVTIGYDAPWRQVHELLIKAAQSTERVLDDPEPRVLQRALSDWYAEYTLTCYTGAAEGRNAVLSELNGAIQDAFNDAGLQIMSPHYLNDKTEPLIVPRDRWFPDPGQTPRAGSGASDAKRGPTA